MNYKTPKLETNSEQYKIYNSRRNKFLVEYRAIQDTVLKQNIKVAIAYTDLCWLLTNELLKATELSFQILNQTYDETLKLKNEYLANINTEDNQQKLDPSVQYSELDALDKQALVAINDALTSLRDSNQYAINMEMQLLDYASKNLFGTIFVKDNFSEVENNMIEAFKFLLNLTKVGTVVDIYEFISNVKNGRIQRIKIVEEFNIFYRDYIHSTYVWSVFTSLRILQLNRKDNSQNINISDSILLTNQKVDKLYNNLSF